MKSFTRTGAIFLFLFTVSFPVFAEKAMEITEMADLPLEELLNTTVTSVSGREQNLSDVANAMYVFTKEDIERSGAREFADLLYRVPGMHIRQLDAHRYGVGIRQNGTISVNNLLVLIDGAVVFNPVISGTLWENLPVTLDEVERIEIIRGPGGVLYSSNAVFGVINIITKSAQTKNNYIAAKTGTQDYRDNKFGVGTHVGQSGLALRTYYENDFNHGFQKIRTSGRISNKILRHRGGMRADYELTDHQKLNVIANYSHQTSDDTGFLSSGVRKRTGETSSLILHYADKVSETYDYDFHLNHVEHAGSAFSVDDVNVHTTSATTQHNIRYDLAGAHVTSIGSEWRYNALNVDDTDLTTALGSLVTNGHDTQKIISFFVQDEYRPWDKWIFTAGVREDANTLVPEHTPLFSPKLSALYHVADNQSLWLASGRTYRTPSFVDQDLFIFAGLTTYRGAAGLDPEKVWTHEAGYRAIFLDNKLKIDTTAFFSDLKEKITTNPTAANNGSLKTRGFEVAANYKQTDKLSFSADYSYIHPDAKPDRVYSTDSLDLESGPSNHILGMGARYTVNKFKFDLYVKYFNEYEVPSTGVDIRGYLKTFLRAAYDFQMPAQLGHNEATIELVANDVFDARHLEDPNNVFIEPTVTVGFKMKF